jgi:hypothetical protein
VANATVTHANAPGWAIAFPTSDGSTTFTTVYAGGATAGWTHLVGVYNSAAHTGQLYVNGAFAATSTGLTAWAATGGFTIGRGLFNGTPADFLPGTVNDIQAWDYALSPPQITALYQQIS